jgi:hypothetical protein
VRGSRELDIVGQGFQHGFKIHGCTSW